MRTPAVALVLGVALALSSAAHAADTLWIFDADFEDLSGDNAGWVVEDRSGTLGHTNYWHKDTIRINGFEWLGDSTWWCGTYDQCWRQPRGYGNEWLCHLERAFPEVEAECEPGDTLVLEWDQRFALEHMYDYGYVDVSTDNGETWTTRYAVTNPSFQGPGYSKDWDDDYYGHQTLDMSDLAGVPFRLRYRVTSDVAYSSEDQYNNPPLNSCKDGAWQLDNITWTVNGDTVWVDDCESPGDNGWTREDIPATGQTGYVFQRLFFEDLGGPSDPRTGWMMAQIDTVTGLTIHASESKLFSPPIDVGGAPGLVASWTAYVDCPREIASVYAYGSEHDECFDEWGPVLWDTFEVLGQPTWLTVVQDWSGYAESPPWWLTIGIHQRTPCDIHGKGFILDRIRLGVPVDTGVPETPTTDALAVHPNPFNPATTIEYSVPTGGPVTLSVYDLTGRRVATLVDEHLAPGPHRTAWDGRTGTGSRAASGVYFLRLVSQSGAHEERVVLLK